jgi:hypothetical protein
MSNFECNVCKKSFSGFYDWSEHNDTSAHKAALASEKLHHDIRLFVNRIDETNKKLVLDLEEQNESLARKKHELEDGYEECYKEINRLEDLLLEKAREMDRLTSRNNILETINKSLAESLLKGKIHLPNGVKSISIEFDEEMY